MWILIAIFAAWGAFFLAAVGYFIYVYNRLISIRNQVKKYWSTVDTFLRQRHEELKKISPICEQDIQYERNVLQDVANATMQAENACTSDNMQEINQSERAIRNSLLNLMAVVENYPSLKESPSFLQLQQQLSDLDKKIYESSEQYNQSVNRYNVKIQKFPTIIIARQFAFNPMEFMHFDVASNSNPS